MTAALTAELVELLNQVAAVTGVSRSEWVCRAVAAFRPTLEAAAHQDATTDTREDGSDGTKP